LNHLNIEGVVFDLDATLVDLGAHVNWRKAHNEIKHYYLKSGCSFSQVEKASLKGLFSMLEEMREKTIKEKSKKKAMDIQRGAYDILCNYETEAGNSCIMMNGCMDALNWLKERNIPIGLCTSNSQKSAENVLKIHNLHKYFNAIVGRSIKHRMKPHPDQLAECFKLLNVDPQRGVMVGDSHKDIIAGKALGAYTIAIPVYFTKRDKIKEANVDKIIENLEELPEALMEI